MFIYASYHSIVCPFAQSKRRYWGRVVHNALNSSNNLVKPKFIPHTVLPGKTEDDKQAEVVQCAQDVQGSVRNEGDKSRKCQPTGPCKDPFSSRRAHLDLNKYLVN